MQHVFIQMMIFCGENPAQCTRELYFLTRYNLNVALQILLIGFPNEGLALSMSISRLTNLVYKYPVQIRYVHNTQIT